MPQLNAIVYVGDAQSREARCCRELYLLLQRAPAALCLALRGALHTPLAWRAVDTAPPGPLPCADHAQV